jgi:hypothetical protein
MHRFQFITGLTCTGPSSSQKSHAPAQFIVELICTGSSSFQESMYWSWFITVLPCYCRFQSITGITCTGPHQQDSRVRVLVRHRSHIHICTGPVHHSTPMLYVTVHHRTHVRFQFITGLTSWPPISDILYCTLL